MSHLSELAIFKMAFNFELSCLNDLFLSCLGLCPLIVMAMSVGKRSWRTKAWNAVVTSKQVKVTVAASRSTRDTDWVMEFLFSFVYIMVAMDRVVIGNV